MAEAGVEIIRWVVKIGFFTFMIFTWTTLTGIIVAFLMRPIESTILKDIASMVQMWAPFHVDSVVAWVTVTIVAYIIYRLALITYNFVGSFIGN